MPIRDYGSWGRYPRATPRAVVRVEWRSSVPALGEMPAPLLAVGMRRSYGDSCLNDGGTVLDATGLDRFIGFDHARGVLRCEAGVTLGAILALVVPHGWFLPVLPGTRWVTVGGAIANDIHGKNHHRAGTFGAHVERFELLRSCGDTRVCSRTENAELFAATIGGLGLTGLVLWAEIRLRRVPGAHIASERIRMRSLDEFLELSASDAAYEHTVAWVDCLANGRRLGRGFFLRGTHVRPARAGATSPPRRFTIPVELPGSVVGRWSVAAFNKLYYRAQTRRVARAILPYEPFFFPLDGVERWNRLYGREGFVQYQCVVPDDPDGSTIRAVLSAVAASGEAPSLAVLKRFGDVPSPGMLSFPRPGITLAADFPLRGARTLDLLEHLDGFVREAGGAVYPAKDARMSPASFRAYFPQWETFARHVDPRFSSSFWRRVGG